MSSGVAALSMRVQVLGLMVLLLLAGCAEKAPADEATNDLGQDRIEVDETTGAIRGLVVDQAITPIEGAHVIVQGAGEQLETTSDADGLFIFNRIDPGTYFVTVSKQFFTEAQSSVQVEAGVTPELVRVQIDQLFDQQPFVVREKFEGYFQCAYNFAVSSTCVNDYTRIDPTGTCPGGCLKELSSLVDNREYVTAIDANWATINIELTWEASLAGTANTMGLTVSYYDRVGAGHNWGSFSGEEPMIARLDVTAVGGDESVFPDRIPYSGLDDFFVFMAAGEGQVAVGQSFEVFQTTSYIAPLPEGYSFVKGDPDPF